MLTTDDLKALGVSEDNIPQIIELLGDAAKKITPENVGKKMLDQVDLALLSTFKIPKKDGEMTSDYAKRITSEHGDKLVAEKTADLNTKIADVQKKLDNHKGDESLKEEIRLLKEEKDKLPDLKNQWIKEHKDAAEKAKADLNTFKRETELRKTIPKLKEGDAEFIEFKVSQTLGKTSRFDKIETDSEGKTYFIDSEKVDKVLADDFWSENLGSLVDKGKVQDGGGGGKTTLKTDAGELKLTAEKEGEKINEAKTFLITQEGLDILSPKFTTRMNDIFKANDLENLMTVKEKTE